LLETAHQGIEADGLNRGEMPRGIGDICELDRDQAEARSRIDQSNHSCSYCDHGNQVAELGAGSLKLTGCVQDYPTILGISGVKG
jgi:hypothetical protein